MTEAAQLRSYGRRKGRPLSARKEHLLKELLPQFRPDLEANPPNDLRELFQVPVAQVWLEIGFGSGEHLLWQAQHHRNVGFIGCEPFINGVASLLGEIETRGLKTILIHDGDAREVLGWLPDRSIGRMFILFPDPWPKKRQIKRRLLSSDTVKELARVLEPGGELRFASDDADYVAAALALIGRNGAFTWLATRPADWRERPLDWPETRYEAKAASQGRNPIYLRFGRS
jgi:tRNA (guanine-N7-)-methyltransferase